MTTPHSRTDRHGTLRLEPPASLVSISIARGPQPSGGSANMSAGHWVFFNRSAHRQYRHARIGDSRRNIGRFDREWPVPVLRDPRRVITDGNWYFNRHRNSSQDCSIMVAYSLMALSAICT